MKEIVISGMALWDTLGYDISGNFQKILDTKSPAPEKIFFRDLKGFGIAETPEGIDEFRQKNFHKIPAPWFNVIGAWTVDRAIQQSGLVQDRSRLAGFATSGYGDAESQLKTFQNYSQGRSRTVPGDFFYTMNDTLVGTISRINDIGGTSVSMAASCSAGLYAIELAVSLIQQDQVDQAIILAQEICTVEYNAYRANGLGVFSKTNLCRPFDRNRDGIIFGDASAAIILESRESAVSRGVKPLASVLGIGTGTQHLHRTNPQGGTDCYYNAFNKALKQSGITPDQIGWISAHATGTRDGDIVENDVMQDLLPRRPITSFKAHIGHAMGACGIVELIYTIEAGKRKIVPQIGNLEYTDINTNLILADRNLPIDSEFVIKNSYGFGGRASSIILQI